MAWNLVFAIKEELSTEEAPAPLRSESEGYPALRAEKPCFLESKRRSMTADTQAITPPLAAAVIDRR
jgi:hypothetical protein